MILSEYSGDRYNYRVLFDRPKNKYIAAGFTLDDTDFMNPRFLREYSTEAGALNYIEAHNDACKNGTAVFEIRG